MYTKLACVIKYQISAHRQMHMVVCCTISRECTIPHTWKCNDRLNDGKDKERKDLQQHRNQEEEVRKEVRKEARIRWRIKVKDRGKEAREEYEREGMKKINM